ncbi:hypothetical protein [Acidovorax sp. BLS4]|uniref:hypothetical protein n=1 Tax=Acidovorax sp. BLS4 TaxID=3273430 RepID=UPI00355C143E
MEVESLVPPSMQEAGAEEFMARLPELDETMFERLRAAASANRVLRYVAHFGADGARVSLCEMPCDHSFAHLRSTDFFFACFLLDSAANLY